VVESKLRSALKPNSASKPLACVQSLGISTEGVATGCEIQGGQW